MPSLVLVTAHRARCKHMRTRLHTLFTGVSVWCSLTLHVFCSQVVPKMSNQIVGLKSVQDEDDDDVADGLCPFVD